MRAISDKLCEIGLDISESLLFESRFANTADIIIQAEGEDIHFRKWYMLFQ